MHFKRFLPSVRPSVRFFFFFFFLSVSRSMVPSLSFLFLPPSLPPSVPPSFLLAHRVKPPPQPPASALFSSLPPLPSLPSHHPLFGLPATRENPGEEGRQRERERDTTTVSFLPSFSVVASLRLVTLAAPSVQKSVVLTCVKFS